MGEGGILNYIRILLVSVKLVTRDILITILIIINF